MADAMVERRPPPRFFCHRCLVEFQDVEQSDQDYVCPYCEGGFIEQLEGDAERPGSLPTDDYSDADMSNIDDMTVDDMGLDDSDEFNSGGGPVMNDLAFLMSGSDRVRSAIANATASAINGTTNNTTNITSTFTTVPSSGNTTNAPNWQLGTTLMEELLWMISGGRPPAGAMTAGAPFVLVGTPGDYVFGGEGLDAVVTQLLGQLEHSGPAPLPRERLAALPTERVTADLAAANTACSVCWENFQIDETVSRLECEHVFHQSCITPWLELHATCPICRRSLLPPGAPEPAAPAPPAPALSAAPSAPSAPSTTTTSTTDTQRIRLGTPLSSLFVNAAPHIVIQRRTGALPTLIRRIPSQTHTWDSLNDSNTSSSISPASSVTAGGVWAANSTGSTNSSTSLNSNDRDRQYNTDMDFD